MEDAVRLEEKGERYASGEKAKTFYERACDLYQNAHSLDPSDLDCLYNWGRVLYILVDFPPNDYPQKLLLLSQSLAKFRQAFTLQPHHVDALFNAAQALTTQAELLQEIDIGENGEHAVAAYEEACSLFQKVIALQEEALHSQKEQHHSHCQKEEAEECETSPSSLVDTLTALSHSLSSLAFLVSSLPEALALYTRAVQVLDRASLFIEKTAAEMEGAEVKACEVQLQRASVLASQADRVAQETGSDVRHLYREALTRIDSVLEKQDANVEAWCDRGDVLCSIAQANKPMETSDTTASQPCTDDDPQTAETFSLYSQASKAYLSAHRLEPRHVSILVKLGDVNLARARLAFPTLPTSSSCESPSPDVPYPTLLRPDGPSLSARTNLSTLLQNAVTYYRRALDEDPKNLGALLRLSQTIALDISIQKNHDTTDSTNPPPRTSSFGSWKDVLKEWSLRGGIIDSLDRAVVDFSDVFDHYFVRAAVQLAFPNLLNTETDEDTIMET